ncbi:hypothetical protein B4U80_14199 [Leptotrombidium deliense]|uniref:Uncharacterized protein n=1 Tax=Leptotrombidium deliense TaxID=299467 RepID=A0A443S0C3_9ACAR|nr:hypothetical protein B4U80_14199 [Leptotrombidium deliense]
MNFIASIIYLTILFGVHSLKHEKESNSETNDEVLNVGIVGAGITGLYSAILLNELGIKYEILEASNRTGGRFYTWYYDNYNGANYNYVEIGAMRFPKIREFDIMIGQQNWSLI